LSELPKPATATATATAPDLGARWPLRADLEPVLLPAYKQPSLVLQAAYGQAQPVGLYIALYQQQRRGHRLVGSDNALLPANDAHWLLAARGSRAVRVGQQTQTLRTSNLRPADLEDPADAATLLVWQLIWVNGHVTASDTLAKLYGAWSRLTGRRDDAAVLLVYAPKGVDGAGEAALAAF
jgi:EpsI family protein